jgi:hypothetical protein
VIITRLLASRSNELGGIQEKTGVLFLKKKNQKDFGAGVDKGEVLLEALGK